MNNHQAAMERVIKARISLNLKEPFYRSLSMMLEPVIDARVDRAATNGKAVFFNPDWTCTQTREQLVFTWLHEIEHCARLHFLRRGFRKLIDWNVCCDHPINLDLIKHGYRPVDDILADTNFRDMSPEEIHAKLYGCEPEADPETKDENNSQDSDGDAGEPDQDGDQAGDGEPDDGDQAGDDGAGAGDGAGEPDDGKASQGKPGKGQGKGSGLGEPSDGSGEPGDAGAGDGKPGAGDGQGEAGKPWEPQSGLGAGGILDADPRDDDGKLSKAEQEALAQQWREAVSQAEAVARRNGPGSIPGHFASITKAQKVETDPREHILQFIQDATVTDLDWSRSNRRNPDPCFIMPGKSNDGIAKIVSVIDVSGSINLNIAEQFVEYNRDLMALGLIGELILIQTDTDVVEVLEFTLGDEIEDITIRRGGGTDFNAVMKYIADEHSDAKAILFLSDMECQNFGEDTGIPTLWLSWSNEKYTRYWTDQFLTYGEIIYITER